MKKHKKMSSNDTAKDESNAWVLTFKRTGDHIAGYVIESIFEDNVRFLKTSERCSLTSFCYPTGSKVVRAKLKKIESPDLEESIAHENVN